jgi:transcription-repair coupling factor (superfamily II helicase)
VETSQSTTGPELVSPLSAVIDAMGSNEDAIRWMRAVRSEPREARTRASEAVVPALLALLAADTAVLAICPTDADAERLADAVAWYTGAGSAAAYLARSVPYGGGIAPSPSRVGSREYARSVAARGGVVVASIEALVERVPSHDIRTGPVHIAVGDDIDRDALIGRLVDIGYERVEQAEQRGQLAARGDIVDVFPTTASHPVRIEFFDTEIDGIRAFSSYTQRSLGALQHVDVLPAAELSGLDLHDPRWAEEAGDDGDTGDAVLDLAGADGMLEAWDALIGSIDGSVPILIIDPASVQRELDECVAELDASHAARRGYADVGALNDAVLADAVLVDQLGSGHAHVFEAEPPVFGAVGFAEAEAELHGLVQRGLRTIVTFPHEGHAGRIERQLRRVAAVRLPDDPPANALGVDPAVFTCVSLAASGFVSRQFGLAVVPSGRLFRRRATGTSGPAGIQVGQALAAFSSLRVGDFVVHEDHGIGRFAGFETKTVAGVTRDYLYLEYDGSDRVYVPHEQMGKVSRYVGHDGSAPTLSKLGGKRWTNLKNRARTAARELAGELIVLYAKRSRAVGHAFPADDELMTRFELTFPHQETDDQQRAIDVVKEDMERPQPMDRLVCGDVGFGKTEVAMRAAMKAVSGGKQAMVLVPTTVLAQQHLASFRERFGDLPVNVDMVSRFRQPKDVTATLAKFAAGEVDVLIGTHRILSRDVLPKDLGLVILDEEQRFGVAQKEMLRQLRLEVDTLSLSATPIPRTLHMSLAGMRDISVIETAPRGRQSIHTHVGEYDEELVRMAIERELDRNGQVFYLHNRVETIEEAAERIRQIVPRARIAVGHGQMTEKQLERVMLGFLRADFDVLVATTIIESGLDIPSANTLIVERADMLGLAQLYQIRGRVGRSTRSAHAYLFYPSARELSEEARARLTTLSDFTDLGSGSRIAMRDLELRGAGNLLGAEQSGHVAAVGFELYVEMLAEAVAEMSGEPLPGEERSTLIDVRIDAYVPADYVASEAIKIDLHRRIALARDDERLDAIHGELEDRFGEVPEPMENLITLARLKLLMGRVGVDRLSIMNGRVSIAPLQLSSNQMAYLTPELPMVVYSANSRELGLRYAEPAERLNTALTLLHATARILGR